MRPAFRRAFTLLELLTVCVVIVILIGLLLPALTRSRDSSRRASDLENLHQLGIATSAYTLDFDGWLPPGRQTTISHAGSPPYSDNYTWLSYNNCWSLLVSRVPGLAQQASCFSVAEGYAYANQFGKVLASATRPGWNATVGLESDCEVGWMYWGGRDDLYNGSAITYRSPSHLGATAFPSSTTLWTCRMWDSGTSGLASSCPHVGHYYMEYPSGKVIGSPGIQHPDGIGIARMDGSASFVTWPASGVQTTTTQNPLNGVKQANGMVIYYSAN